MSLLEKLAFFTKPLYLSEQLFLSFYPLIFAFCEDREYVIHPAKDEQSVPRET